MVELIRGLDPAVIRRNLEAVRAEVGEKTEVLAATKYVAREDIHLLVEAGVTVLGENRAQDLVAKHADHPDLTWDFIGQLQSRKVKQILPLVRYVHSVDSDSVLHQLQTHGTSETRILVQVNVAREEGKAGVLPDQLGDFIARARATGVQVVGLMTMPPLAPKPQDNARWFAALADLAATHDLAELSMGTTQDYAVAAREGATIVRVGTRLYTPS
jgi:pyridoxal phosphate enzyme (YggS family)